METWKYSPPAQNYINRLPDFFYKEVVESFTLDEKKQFEKYCEDLLLPEEDDVIIAYKTEVKQKLNYLFSKEAIEKRAELKKHKNIQDQQAQKEYAVLEKYADLNWKDIEAMKDYGDAIGQDIVDKFGKKPSFKGNREGRDER